jgi:hypothetical protein
VLQNETNEKMVEASVGKRQIEQTRRREIDIPVTTCLKARTSLAKRDRRNIYGHNLHRRVP